MKRFFLLTVSVVLSIMSASGQTNPVSWQVRTEKAAGDTVNVIFEASIQSGWHLYDLGPYKGGPNETVFTFEVSEGASLAGGVEYTSEPIRQNDPVFNMEIGFFENQGGFCQKVVTKDGKGILKANIEWMSCNSSNCVPPDDIDFEVDLSQAGAPASSQLSQAPEDEPSATAEEETSARSKRKGALIALILEAVAWGLAALVTPCVFPMIPMTVSYFIKGSDNKAAGRFRAFMYGLFIVLLYTVPIALIIFITWIAGGASVTADIFNWLATHWLPNILFFIVFMVFAASFFGAFEIVMPSSIVNKSDKNSDKKGLGGVFFMALTLVLVSFSCTGPIVGTVLIKSTSGEFWEPMVTMLAFSVAFALPFTLFALFPAWLKKLPKSGGWLNSVKVVLGFIEVALGFKFLSTADQTYQWGLLDREVYLAIWIVCFTMLGFYLLGKLRFKYDEPVERISVLRLTLSIITFSFVVYMIPGMWGAPLKAISGYLPPMQTQDFVLGQQTPGRTVYVNAPSGSSEAFPSKIKYGDSGLELPNGLQGFLDLKEAEEYAEKVGKPLFIDFTGLGCMNCREMEARVLSDPEILEMLREDYVVVSLFGDDKKTEVAPEDWVVNDAGKTLKTLGKINSYYVLKEFGINAQPYYILKGHGKLLAEPRSYNLDVAAFRSFLRDGIKTYESGE
ncbi:MAG: thioredoxin family protein [Bacteroidales bacterium]|nr:thioredoxin family protein [Candidatus Cacconaster merdequi]